MSQENVELVRALYAAWGHGDFSSLDWVHPDVEYVVADGPEPATFKGVNGMVEYGRGLLAAWEDWRVEAEEYRALDDERVLVLDRHSGRGRTSGLNVDRMTGRGASVFRICGGKVSRLVVYWDRDRALADLGLAE